MIEGQVLFVRGGKLVGNLAYSFADNEFPDEVCAEFLSQFYQGKRFTSNEILLPVVLVDADVRAELLAERKEKPRGSLRRALHLQNAPKWIECFDISNTQGDLAVGSLVVFDECEPDKKRYRRFRIKTVEGADDYGMMYEVLTRRYRRALEEHDLLMVDGDKGQLGVAVEVLRELGITEVDVIGLAKMRT